MSVTLEKYCETSQSNFAESLKVALRNGVFIRVDMVTIEKDYDEVRAYVDVKHSLSKTDFELIIAIFDGLDWQICTSCFRCTYRVIFNLTAGWL